MNDDELKVALAKMLPGVIHSDTLSLYWNAECDTDVALVLDTELLHLCSLLEAQLTEGEYYLFQGWLAKTQDMEPEQGFKVTTQCTSATWQQRVTALIPVIGGSKRTTKS